MTRYNRQVLTILAAAAALAIASVRPAGAQTVPARPQTDVEKKAIDFLVSKQEDSGAWMPRVGPGMTAMVARGLIQGGKTVDDPAVQKALQYIESTRKDDGGYYVDTIPTYNTAIVLSLLAKLPHDAYAGKIKKAQDFLKGTQLGVDPKGKDSKGEVIDKKHPWFGGWGYGGGGPGAPDLSNSHFVVEALRDSGVPADDPSIRNALIFVTRMQANSETNDTAWGKEHSDESGGFIYSMAMNRKLNTFGASSAPETERDGKTLLTTYGGITYAGLKSMLYADLKKDDPRVKAAVKWVQNNWRLDINPGIGDEKGIFYYYHNIGSALSAYGEDSVTDSKGVKHDWRADLFDAIKKRQKDNGSFANAAQDRWMEQDPNLATTYVVLTLQSMRK
jgi:squalene-hopene/tetraprenyl-beta-curcumene cyclase